MKQTFRKSIALFFAVLLLLTGCTSAVPGPNEDPSGQDATGGGGVDVSDGGSKNDGSGVVDPASCEFPQLQDFFNRAAYYDRSRDSHGMEWEFRRMTPYAGLETAEAELLAFLQQPRWQLTLVDTNTWTYETGDITQATEYCFDYTGTAELTKVSHALNRTQHHVFVMVYHIPSNNWYDIMVWRSPEFQVVETDVRCSVDVGEYANSGSSGSSWKGGKYENKVPEHTKPDCRTCGGDGDCNTCGGDGYTRIGGAKAGCRTCHGNGKCRSCNGTGKQ
ncbi:MAG: hypothetical protein E7223_04975 [Clostridiales bacterium]|nr:hypothetical protein [Clostridiales bacterium]